MPRGETGGDLAAVPAGGSAPRSLPGGDHGHGRASSGQPFNCWAGALPAEGDYGFADCSLAQARELTQLGSALAPEGAASAPGGQAAPPRGSFCPLLGFLPPPPPPGEYMGCLPKQRSGTRTPGSLPSSTLEAAGVCASVSPSCETERSPPTSHPGDGRRSGSEAAAVSPAARPQPPLGLGGLQPPMLGEPHYPAQHPSTGTQGGQAAPATSLGCILGGTALPKRL